MGSEELVGSISRHWGAERGDLGSVGITDTDAASDVRNTMLPGVSEFRNENQAAPPRTADSRRAVRMPLLEVLAFEREDLQPKVLPVADDYALTIEEVNPMGQAELTVVGPRFPEGLDIPTVRAEPVDPCVAIPVGNKNLLGDRVNHHVSRPIEVDT
jgi:hypothetical protein